MGKSSVSPYESSVTPYAVRGLGDGKDWYTTSLNLALACHDSPFPMGVVRLITAFGVVVGTGLYFSGKGTNVHFNLKEKERISKIQISTPLGVIWRWF